MDHPEILPQHRWLERLLGTWRYEAEAEEAGGEVHRVEGSETFRRVGGVWFVSESDGDGAQGIMTLGYDATRSRFVGSYLSSMMTHLWIYEGRLDHDNRRLVLECEGPSMEDPLVMAPYQDILEFVGDDERVLTSRYRDKAGDWRGFMTMRFWRTGPA